MWWWALAVTINLRDHGSAVVVHVGGRIDRQLIGLLCDGLEAVAKPVVLDLTGSPIDEPVAAALAEALRTRGMVPTPVVASSGESRLALRTWARGEVEIVASVPAALVRLTTSLPARDSDADADGDGIVRELGTEIAARRRPRSTPAGGA